MAINAAERGDVKFLEKQARLHAAQNAEVLKGIMSNAFGRAWMYDLLEACHIGASPFSTDIAQMSFNCGEQNLGLRYWAALMTVCPDMYTLMMQEHNERSIRTDVELARSQDAGGGDQAGWSHHDAPAGSADATGTANGSEAN